MKVREVRERANNLFNEFVYMDGRTGIKSDGKESKVRAMIVHVLKKYST